MKIAPKTGAIQWIEDNYDLVSSSPKTIDSVRGSQFELGLYAVVRLRQSALPSKEKPERYHQSL